jgi:hypothetical protein
MSDADGCAHHTCVPDVLNLYKATEAWPGLAQTVLWYSHNPQRLLRLHLA